MTNNIIIISILLHIYSFVSLYVFTLGYEKKEEEVKSGVKKTIPIIAFIFPSYFIGRIIYNATDKNDK